MKGTVYFFTGLAGAGKTTIGGLFYKRLLEVSPGAVLKDGDSLRAASGHRDYSTESRKKGAWGLFQSCLDLANEGKDVVVCSISMYEEVRAWNRDNIDRYKEIYVKASMETLLHRNQKGLYSPGVKQVVGVDLPWDEPRTPDIVIENDGAETPEMIVNRLAAALGLEERP